MAAFSRFSEDVSEEELNALIQKAVPEKTKIAWKYDLKNFKGKKKKLILKYQFDSFTRHIHQKKYCCSFVSSSEISTKTIRILTLNFYQQSIK